MEVCNASLRSIQVYGDPALHSDSSRILILECIPTQHVPFPIPGTPVTRSVREIDIGLGRRVGTGANFDGCDDKALTSGYHKGNFSIRSHLIKGHSLVSGLHIAA